MKRNVPEEYSPVEQRLGGDGHNKFKCGDLQIFLFKKEKNKVSTKMCHVIINTIGQTDTKMLVTK
jgi:hypothetical protein